MTTERSSFDDPGSDATMDDAMGNVDRVTATRDEELESTGLSDTPFPEGAGTSTPTMSSGGASTDWASSSTGSRSGSRSTSGGASGDKLQDAASGVMDRVAGTAQQQVGSQVDSQLNRGADMLDQVSRAIRQSGETLRQDQPQMASFADTAAQQVDKATQFLRQNDFQGLVREAEDFARRQPALFLGGALLLGVAASRFLKASPQGGGSQQYRGSYGSGYRSAYGSYGSSSYGYGRGSQYGSSQYGGSQAGGDYGRPYGGSYGSGSYAGSTGGSSYGSAQANYGTQETGPYGGSGSGSSYAGAGSGSNGGTGSGVMNSDEGAERGGV